MTLYTIFNLFGKAYYITNIHFVNIIKITTVIFSKDVIFHPQYMYIFTLDNNKILWYTMYILLSNNTIADKHFYFILKFNTGVDFNEYGYRKHPKMYGIQGRQKGQNHYERRQTEFCCAQRHNRADISDRICCQS